MARYSGSKELHGTWLIVNCQGHAADGSSLQSLLKGIEFSLDKGGSVFWQNEHNVDFPPSFCDTYEVCSSHYSTFLRFAGFKGSVIEFRIQTPSIQELVLLFESFIILTCKRIATKSQSVLDNSFSLTHALEEGYFSDFELCAANGHTFQVHRTILSLSLGDFDWQSLNGLPEAVLSTMLHFSYSYHLPPTLSSQTAKLCIEHFQNQPALENLVRLCQSFLKNTAARAELHGLVNSIHASLERMVSLFDSNNEADMLVNAARLWQAVKQSLGEGVLVVVRFVQLCVTFTKHKTDFSSEERREIVTFFRSRLPIFVSQVYRLLKCFRNLIGGLSASQNFVLASYIAPEVEGALSVIWALAVECLNITEQIVLFFPIETYTGHLIADTLLDKEAHKLKNLHEKLLLAVKFLSHKKEKYTEMTVSSQVRSVMRNIKLFVEEIPLVIFRLEEIIASLDESLTVAEFQFTFYNVSSKINETIHHLRELKTEPNVRALLQQVCDLVQREELNLSLVALELLDNSGPSTTQFAASPPNADCVGADSLLTNSELSMYGPLCREPMASNSPLARQVSLLLENKNNSDLEFLLPSDADTSQVVHAVKAHRVVLAARCRWFHRALLSGMREAIDRKITLPDCSSQLLSLFLRFLYGDHLDQTAISNEQLIELLIMADRFEVEQLSSGCQTVLTSRLDNSNVLCMLAIADQWSATQLQESCISFIWKHGDMVDKEGLEDLPAHLRSQVQLHTSNSNSSKHHWLDSLRYGKDADIWRAINSDRSISSRSSSSSSSSSSSKESVDLLQELTNEMRIVVAEVEQEQQEQLLENCVSALEDILGSEVSRPELLRLALAADCDINRAVNYYLSQPDTSNLSSKSSSK
ncbi:LOW QUALITY PROTEIN: uncharacterized protein LOC130688040 [Daphnia carinata]|uniref:LOW QUALITY PROTEIN: uncharacterized protein LOC130688040 n=1 Tax=Daphnia carinata TaxID=120202 RepID=UPI00257C1C00|nr:LOW QUALITY PROTEIN: uncharacterized protein LOC130688040 [Daphnia carinata]